MGNSIGYKLNDVTNVISTPFADDFNVISTNSRTHQRLLNNIETHAKSMNLCLEPNKCKSLSICSGSSKIIDFKLSELTVGSIANSPEKFLGSHITYLGKQSEIFDIIHSSILKVIENIDNSPIRDEFKVKIYTQYLLPAIRFKLTVHEITTTNLAKLDALGDRYLKKWLAMPQSGTMAIAHSKHGLGIKSFTQIYKEAHAISHTTSRLKADKTVNDALDSKITREQNWTRKESIAVYSENHYANAQDDSIQSNITSKHMQTVKNKVKANVNQEFQDLWTNHIKGLAVQGRFLEILALEKSHITWKSIIYNLPRGLLQFTINASIDTLATNANLKRWGKRSNAKCDHCGGRETLHHVLNNCQALLERYTWRHNSILSCLYKTIKDNISPPLEIFADLPGHHPGNTTIPPDILPTSLKPDMVLLNRPDKTIILFELSVPFETNIEPTHNIKIDRYLNLISDIEENNFKVKYYPVEIGSRGYISKDNISRLRSLLKDTNSHISFKSVKESLCKIAIISSFVIYHSKFDVNWINPTYASI
jgi:hypothetical protein